MPPFQVAERPTFEPLPADPNGTVTYIHLGDLHMKDVGAQNDLDLDRIVDTINRCYAQHGISFVYLPGDIADDGSASSYRLVRDHLDRLSLPWCGIVGDHDVHEKSFENFQTYIAQDLTSAFSVGNYRFLRANAFSRPRPDSFIIDEEQLAWIERELRFCEEKRQRAVLLLHCYPSDLKQGGDALAALIHKYSVLLTDMGHTHYNEISNDGRSLYSATRSTGQIEEGPVGFSVVTLDEAAVSWHFVQLDAPELVSITMPPDRRLEIEPRSDKPSEITVRAKIWSRDPILRVSATVHGAVTELNKQGDVLWSGALHPADMPHGSHRLTVDAITVSGKNLSDTIEMRTGPRPPVNRAPLDQDNIIGVWKERGILGTQLGPNKNGRKW